METKLKERLKLLNQELATAQYQVETWVNRVRELNGHIGELKYWIDQPKEGPKEVPVPEVEPIEKPKKGKKK